MEDSLLVGRAAALLAAGTGWAWRPEPGSIYAANEVGVWYGQVGTEPDRACGLTLYSATDVDVRNGLPGPRRLQLWFRGERGLRAGADELADVAFTFLHGRSVPGLFQLIKRVSSVPLGADGVGRQQRSDNYEFQPDLEA